MSKKANKVIVIIMVIFMLLGVVGGIVAPMVEGHNNTVETWGAQ